MQSMDSRLVKIVEAMRIISTAVGFSLAYKALEHPPTDQAIRTLTLTYAISLCGTCAFEGLFLAKATAKEKGYDHGQEVRVNPYHRQNTMWFLSASIVGVAWASNSTTTVNASLLYITLTGGFFILSAINHAWEAIAHGNSTWQNLNRPFLLLAMAGASIQIALSYR